MSTADATTNPPGRRHLPEKPLAFRPPRRWWLRIALGAAVAAVLAGAGYAAALTYPDGRPPQGTALEANIAQVFGVPQAGIDDRVVGDFLIERFYILDAESGSRYVGDLMKGRIQSVQTQNENGLLRYTLVLSLQNLNRDRALYAAFIETVARPSEPGLGEYLGLRVPVGLNDAFALNYSGLLPPARVPFSSEDNETLQQFLLSKRFAEVSQSPALISVEGYNYLLSNTDLFPYFRGEFGIGKAIFVSELLIVDATAPAQQRAYFRLTEQYPRTLR